MGISCREREKVFMVFDDARALPSKSKIDLEITPLSFICILSHSKISDFFFFLDNKNNPIDNEISWVIDLISTTSEKPFCVWP